MITFNQQEISLLINAVHHYKVHSEKQRQQRSKQGWDTSEQQARVVDLDGLEEKLYARLDQASEGLQKIN